MHSLFGDRQSLDRQSTMKKNACIPVVYSPVSKHLLDLDSEEIASENSTMDDHNCDFDYFLDTDLMDPVPEEAMDMPPKFHSHIFYEEQKRCFSKDLSDDQDLLPDFIGHQQPITSIPPTFMVSTVKEHQQPTSIPELRTARAYQPQMKSHTDNVDFDRVKRAVISGKVFVAPQYRMAQLPCHQKVPSLSAVQLQQIECNRRLALQRLARTQASKDRNAFDMVVYSVEHRLYYIYSGCFCMDRLNRNHNKRMHRESHRGWSYNVVFFCLIAMSQIQRGVRAFSVTAGIAVRTVGSRSCLLPASRVRPELCSSSIRPGVWSQLHTKRAMSSIAISESNIQHESCIDHDSHPAVTTTASLASALTKPKVVFVLGGPGAGKGTQCERLAQSMKLMHLSAGELLRNEQTVPNSPHASVIDNCLKNGKIVPVEISLSLLQREIQRAVQTHGQRRFLVDGFPRNMDNLQGWDRMMEETIDIEMVIVLECQETQLEKRILERSRTSNRSDDNLTTLHKRFETFTRDSVPAIEVLRNRALTTGLFTFLSVDGNRNVDVIAHDIQRDLYAEWIRTLKRDDRLLSIRCQEEALQQGNLSSLQRVFESISVDSEIGRRAFESEQQIWTDWRSHYDQMDIAETSLSLSPENHRVATCTELSLRNNRQSLMTKATLCREWQVIGDHWALHRTSAHTD